MTAPAELAELDLFEIWSAVEPPRSEFDPFRFTHRMGAYRQLIEATNHDGLFGPDNRNNPLWGFMFQHLWQFRSGRLGEQALATDQIDPDAAWGYCNYILCAVPWLGAVAAGTVPDVPLAGPPAASRFRYPHNGVLPEGFVVCVSQWRAYFELVAATGAGADLEPVRFAMWKAHKTCLDVVSARIRGIDPAPYATAELTFLHGWCRMVDYLSLAAWRSDFDFTTTYGLDILPERLLDGRANTDLTKKVRRNTRNVLGLARMPAWRHSLNLRLWRRIMRTRKARDEVLTMLDALFNPNRGNTAARRRLLGYLLRP